jgi:hypothetical protein
VSDSSITPLAASDLNLPSIAFSRFTGSGSTVRTFTSVDRRRQSWRTSVVAPAGVLGTVTPASFDIAPGATQAVTLTLTAAGAPTDSYTSGAVVLTNTLDDRTVRLPVTVKPVKINAPPRLEVTSGAAAGIAPLPVRVGFAGGLTALGWGLVPPRVAAGQRVATAVPTVDHPWEESAGVRTYDVEVPAGAKVLAAAITLGDTPKPPGSGLSEDAAETDLDLYLFRDQGEKGFGADDVVARSAGPVATESIALAMPPPGSYRFTVVGFKTPQLAAGYDFTTWLGFDPSPDDPASPSTTPGFVVDGDAAEVAPGDSVELRLTWSGVTDAGTYFGLVTYYDQTPVDPQSPFAATLVRVVRGPG